MKISYDGLLAIASEEAAVLQTYDDRGTPANGFGHQDKSLKPGQKTTLAAAWATLESDANIAGAGVERYVTVPLLQHEFDPLVSLAFNYGVTGFSKLDVVKLLNAGDRRGAIAAWHAITKNEGRRDREADTFDSGTYPPARNKIKLSETGGGVFSWKLVDPPPRPVGTAPASPVATPSPSGYLLTWLPGILRAAGLTVIEEPGWATRGHGDVGNIVGVICHHTAGPKNGNAPSVGVVTNGRPGLSGPLAQVVLGRDGTYYAIAAGKCYHAGAGKWQGITDGNGRFIGIEAENTGLANDTPWPAVQMDAYRRGVAAILKHIGAAAIMCAGHREYALPKGRKSDPDFDMVAFRIGVEALMGGHPAPAPSPAPSPSPPPATGKFKVVGVKPDTLTLRSSASAKSQPRGKLPEGTLVTKVGASGTWVNVKTPGGFVGWVAGKYLAAA